MIFDTLTKLSDAQALTTTAASTSYIDLGVSRDIGVGQPIEVFCEVMSALVSGGSSTCVFAVETDTQSSFATAVTLIATAAIAKATLVAGYRPINAKLPAGVQRYIRMKYTVGTTDFTGGTVTAGLILDQQNQAFYASGLRTTGF